ncbi:MAG: glycosyltransferase family 9 protein, partial [Candidatus Omnitrophica bacterium]|nr:glycosyltransferase family 9 protein [Candidatus Omnitrophota bacterium]
LDEKKLVAVVPGGGASWGKHSGRKRWSADGFARTAEVLARSGWDILVLGDDSEYRVCEDVAKGVPSGKTVRDNSLNLKDYAAILSKARLVLCNDGGPLHIAVSLGVSTVSIFGPVDPVVYGPYPVTDNHRVVTIEGLPCRPCYGRFRLPECGFGGKCLAGIDPERVGKICLELLEKG